MDDRPPLGESSTHGAVLREAIPQTIKPLGYALIGKAGERLCAGVDFDAGEDPLGRENLGKRRAGGTLLTDRFVIQDDTADELGGARGGKEHLPVVTPALLG